jgi:integrase
MKYSHRYQGAYKGFSLDVKANSQKELVAKIEKRKTKIDRGDITDSSVKDWRELWLETYKRPMVSDRWYGEIKRICSKLEPIDSIKVNRVRPAQLQNIINDELGKATSTAKKTYDVIRAIFHQAYINNLLETDITKALKMPATKPKHKRRAITPKEREMILKTIPKHPKGVFFAIMLYAGLRPGEVRALQWRDVDLKNKVITVSKAGKERRVVGGPKTRAGIRKIPLCRELEKYLDPKAPFDFVCPNEYGLMMTNQNYKDMWHSFKRLLHIEMGGKLVRNKMDKPCMVADDLTPYCLRHTYGTDLEKKKVPINIAKVLMGHENISTTSKIYTHFDDETMEMAQELINGRRNPTRKKIPRGLKLVRSNLGS